MPFDYFHVNSIGTNSDGKLLISARNTSAIYTMSTLTGRLQNMIGGRHSTVKRRSWFEDCSSHY